MTALPPELTDNRSPLPPLPPLLWVGEMSPDEVAGRISRGAILGEVVQQWLDRCREVAARAGAQ